MSALSVPDFSQGEWQQVDYDEWYDAAEDKWTRTTWGPDEDGESVVIREVWVPNKGEVK